jgi:hypothetical protein
VFGCPVAFDQPYHFISLPTDYLARPMALANPATVQMCEQQCEALLATLDVQEGLLPRIRRLLLARPASSPTWTAPRASCTPAGAACAVTCRAWAPPTSRSSMTSASAWPCST